MMDQLRAGVRHLGLQLNEKQVAQFQSYYEELVVWNERFNLTAITEYEQVQIRHFCDSLSGLLALRGAARLPRGRALRGIDVGSGAGFPGVPIKIYCPQMQLVLLEATGKKVDFLQHAIAHLGLSDIEAIKGRAEDLAHEPTHREAYDLVFARAVAELPVLAEYTLPFCRRGGLVVAHKGVTAPEEVHAAEYAMSMLGGQVQQVIPVELLNLAEARHLVVIEKVAGTPAQYPRRAGMPGKRPLQEQDD